jgi:hypothetical protein
LVDEGFDTASSADEGCGQVAESSLADDHEQARSVTYHAVTFVGLIADPAIVGQSHPVPLADSGEPVLVSAVGREVVSV